MDVVTRSRSFTGSRENEKDIGVSKTKGHQKSEGGSDNDLFFENDEESKGDDLLLDSPKGSVSSSVFDYDEEQLIDEEDDEFEDALGDDEN